MLLNVAFSKQAACRTAKETSRAVVTRIVKGDGLGALRHHTTLNEQIRQTHDLDFHSLDELWQQMGAVRTGHDQALDFLLAQKSLHALTIGIVLVIETDIVEGFPQHIVRV